MGGLPPVAFPHAYLPRPQERNANWPCSVAMQNVLSGNPSGLSAPAGDASCEKGGFGLIEDLEVRGNIAKNVSQVPNDRLAISDRQNRPLLCTPHRSDVDDRRRRILPESLTDVVDP